LKKLKVNDQQNTKIVATIGPASSSSDVLLELIKAGVDVFRLNFSHGSHDVHKQTIERIVELKETYNVAVGILADLQGPKISMGEIQDDQLPIAKGDLFTFVNRSCIGTKEAFDMS